MKTCEKCKCDFTPNGNAQKFCCRCLIKVCKWCGSLFISKNRHRHQIYCSALCRESVKIGKLAYPNIIGKRGKRPRTYHISNRLKHGNAFDREWRRSVFERDNYTCKKCGQRGGRLQAHHIKPYKEYLDLRYDINNGQTLCVDCHKRTENYGWSMYWTEIAAKRIESENRQYKMF